MQANERQARILEEVQAQGEVTIAALSENFGVSEMTIRRDLAQLEEQGLLRRNHGGAVRAASGSFEPPFALRATQNDASKQRIAQQIAGQLRDGETVILDGGSTGVAIAEAIADRYLTVCALNLRVADILAESSNIRLLLPGGFVRQGELSFSGPGTIRALAEHQFDTYVMTVSGLDTTAGLTEWNVDDAATKRAALEASSKCIVAADSSKFGQKAFSRIAPLNSVDLIVTDTNVDASQRAAISAGTQLQLA